MTPRQRREKGTGAVFQREADGMWCVTVELPPRDGKRRRKTIVRKRKADAVSALRELRAELDRTGDLPTASPTMATWLTLWLDTIAAPRLKPRTLSEYRGHVDRYIVPAIGRIRLDKLTPDHVRRVHAYVTDQGLSSTTALQTHRILAKSLTDAMRDGRVSRNVATLLDAPRKAVATRQGLTADEARTLLMSVADRPDEAAAWSVALLAGLRQGERLGLTMDALDLEAGMLTVSWQLQRLAWVHGCAGKEPASGWPCGKKRAGSCPERHVKIPADQEATRVDGGLWLTRPKSRSGWREVPLAPPLHAVLERYIAEHPPGMHGLIFTREDGRPIDPSTDTSAWDAALKRAGLPDVVLHSARHTTATLLRALGVDELTRMAILGHSSATVTAGYTHIATADTRAAVALLGDLLNPLAITED